MKYAIYFTWKSDKFSDSFIVEGAAERNRCLKNLLNREEIEDVMFCPIYKNGEYGKRIKAI